MAQAIKPTKIYSKKITQLQLDGSKKSGEMMQFEYKNKDISINKIQELAINLRKKQLEKKKNVKIQLVMQTPYGHRSGRFYNMNDRDIHVWNPNDYTYDSLNNNHNKRIKWFNDGKAKPMSFYFNVIYLNDKGGTDNHNDCLYNCLFVILGAKLTKVWDYPKKLKNYLDIDRDDMVNANEHIDKIEGRLKVQIEISGDVSRLPKINAKTIVKLVLQNSHYKVMPSQKQAIKGVSFQERKPVMYNYDYDNDNYTLYDGTEQYTATKEQYREMNKLSSTSMLLRVSNKEDLEKEYNVFIDQANKLLEETNGRVNMYKTGSIKATALKFFQQTTKAVQEADKIQGLEGHLLLDTYRGGTLYSKPYKGKAYKADYCSQYPSIMTSKMEFPYKAGQFLKISKEEMSTWIAKEKQYFKYGIYRAVISGNIHKAMFRENKLHAYTHIDMGTAHTEGYNIELIQDGKCNFLFYPRNTRISGAQLFKEFVEELYPIKERHNKDVPELNFEYAKKLLNILWGALSEKRVCQEIYTSLEDDSVLELGINEEVADVVMLGQGKCKYETESLDDLFVSGYARISPFLTAKARQIIADMIRDNCSLDSVVRVHTDGIITSTPLKNTFKNKTDALLGELGYEGFCGDCTVVNMGRPKGAFTI